jgi:hypothetical protein
MFVTPNAPTDDCRCWLHSTSGTPHDVSIQYQCLDTLLWLDYRRACELFCWQLPLASGRD